MGESGGDPDVRGHSAGISDEKRDSDGDPDGNLEVRRDSDEGPMSLLAMLTFSDSDALHM